MALSLGKKWTILIIEKKHKRNMGGVSAWLTGQPFMPTDLERH